MRPMGTAFTVSIDYKVGLTTGISAEERCATVHALANHNVQAGDFVRPGHVFPLVAKRGGVLMRSGHTEAAVDLARLAGEPPVGVIGELVNDRRIGQARPRSHGLRARAWPQDHLRRRPHRLPAIARAAGRAGRGVRRGRRRSARRAALPIRRRSTACSIWRSSSAISAAARTFRSGCTAKTWSKTCSATAGR